MSSENTDTKHESKFLEEKLTALAGIEKVMEAADKDAEIYRIRKTQKIFEQRRSILKEIPKFWYIVLAENEDFSEYLGVDDLKYLETISDIYVHYNVADTDDVKHYRDFSITISFKDETSGKENTSTKSFEVVLENGEEKLVSEPAEIQWPQELDDINPSLIKQRSADKELSKEDKKKYRLGMKSIFAWFAWTGKKPGKEFREGEDLARLIAEDVFPYAVKYYVEAMPGVAEDDDSLEDSSEGEELDISDDEPPRKKRDV